MDKVSAAVILLALMFGYTVTGYAQETELIALELYQTPVFSQLSDQTWLLGVSSGKSQEQRNDRPPLSALRIGGEIAAGGVGAIAGMWGTYLIHRDDIEHARGEYGWVHRLECMGAASIITPIASSTAVYITGNIGNEEGSFFAALLGGFVGECAAGIILFALYSLRPNVSDALSDLTLALVTGTFITIGATIGFNLTRKYGSSANSGNQMSNTAPSIHLNLARVRF